jgi:hypothetical protein
MKSLFAFMVAKIKTGFQRLSDAKLLTKSLDIYTSMNGNLNFLTPVPTMADVNGSILAFQAALTSAAARERTQVILKNHARASLITMLKELANYVTFTANGDAGILSGSGFDMRKVPEPVYVPKPSKILVTDGLNSGELTVSVSKPRGARSFVHQYTPDPLTASSIWVSIPSTSKTYTFTGLEKAKNYWCRVGIVGSNGQLVYSDPVSRVVQ